MYNYLNPYNPQISLDRINNQIAELEKMKQQMQQPIQPPTSLTQNFQIAPTNQGTMKYANNLEEVQKEMVIGDTPYFSKDMSVVWVKNAKGEIKIYSLAEIVQKDEKDLQIEFLQAQINELKKGLEYEPINECTDESTSDDKSTRSKTNRGINKK